MDTAGYFGYIYIIKRQLLVRFRSTNLRHVNQEIGLITSRLVDIGGLYIVQMSLPTTIYYTTNFTLNLVESYEHFFHA